MRAEQMKAEGSFYEPGEGRPRMVKCTEWTVEQAIPALYADSPNLYPERIVPAFSHGIIGPHRSPCRPPDFLNATHGINLSSSASESRHWPRSQLRRDCGLLAFPEAPVKQIIADLARQPLVFITLRDYCLELARETICQPRLSKDEANVGEV
ncbi:hypothetical protein VC83_02858 [Pseudogymnoascus destructans]|uniref:Uncharacterized protein n=2 Tax=Pseudogymnoascus destructans TaxID=655981 RepID=L8FZ23_PSED2|nr:uncharacterized protein VC83_02858 [Pseudogymnoascus destructans]ELR04971.1 hypothetical protein GMDG_00228 [Pseudogymnoascus destructans 20631-21]OAF60098.1 hypothetical protein VC83_02858 [Pseudogymnoascus destructans]